MNEITLLLNLKARWLEVKEKFLVTVAFLFIFWGGNAQTYTYTGSVQTVTLSPGTYEIEMWGGNGGDGGGKYRFCLRR